MIKVLLVCPGKRAQPLKLGKGGEKVNNVGKIS